MAIICSMNRRSLRAFLPSPASKFCRTTEHHPDSGKSSFSGPVPRARLRRPTFLVRPRLVLDRYPRKSQLAPWSARSADRACGGPRRRGA
jgi:hypothetical protein